jgi:predicted flap endonuclease-1-like 5' DNA nuclease
MNETTAASQSGASLLPDGIGTITTIHMVLMALVAIAAIAIILVGMRRAAARRHAERQVKINAREAGVPAAPDAPLVQQPKAVPTPVPAPTPPAPPPPAPPRPVPVPPLAPTPPPAIDPAPVDPAPLDDEPIAAAAPLDASPATLAAPEPLAPEPATVGPAPASAPALATDPADTPVTMLKGLGPKLEARLASLGITTVGQLASLSPAEAASLDAQLGPFTGRMARDRWLEQARLLASGDRAGFEAAFGRL